MSSIVKRTPSVGLPLALATVIALSVAAYSPILFPPSPAIRYPWSSDAWGHLIKVEFLYEQLRAGVIYPNIFPGWYNGVQLLRYYAPAPYYLMAAIYNFYRDIFSVGNWFVYAGALFGALSVFLFRSRLGLLPTTIASALYLFLPDHLRVTFAEGNIPRVMAFSLLPLTFYFLVQTIESGGRRRDFVSLSLCIALIVLSHAMMAAIFFVCLALFTLIHWEISRAPAQGALAGLFGLGVGMVLSGWWLFPSLTGGITELNQTASSEALVSFPISFVLDPIIRLRDREAYYLGLAFLLGAAIAATSWKKIPALSRSMLLVGVLTGLISSTFFNDIYNSIPFNHLFWPVRFNSFTGFALLMGTVGIGAYFLQGHRIKRLIYGLLVIALAVDFSFSIPLIHGRPLPEDVTQVSRRLKELSGWRVAAADLSLLGSAPSQLFTNIGGREQIYGWGYQGSTTAPVVAGINFALDNGYPDYAVSSLYTLGTDDVVIIKDERVPDEFRQALLDAGFKKDLDTGRVDLYHRDGGPRAYVMSHRILGIGDGAQNLAFMFPEVEIGSSKLVDSYDLSFLRKYEIILLSRFGWNSRQAAEQLMEQYVAAGGKLVVDLTDAPQDVFARVPKFMGVYGEPVFGLYSATIRQGDQTTHLRPFPKEYLPWIAFSPQGLSEVDISFDYLGLDAVALGHKDFNGKPVWFIGMNLIFQALTTHDPVSVRILADLFGSEPGKLPDRPVIPLNGYETGQDGYRFSYRLDQPADLLVPVAKHDGTIVIVDGRQVDSWSIGRLVMFSAPAGEHQVFITTRDTFIYTFGRAVTLAGLIALAGYLTLRDRLLEMIAPALTRPRRAEAPGVA